MKKNKFLTAICMLSTFVGTNLHAKTAKGKKTVKAKTSHKPLNVKITLINLLDYKKGVKTPLIK